MLLKRLWESSEISGIHRLYLVSACLLGLPCAYDGRGRPVDGLLALAACGQVVPICPEAAGGLPIPRPPAEIVGGDGGDVLDGRARVVTVAGDDVTAAFLRGAARAGCRPAARHRHGDPQTAQSFLRQYVHL